MRNLIVDNTIYPNLFSDDKTLIKYSSLPYDIWIRIKGKNLPFLNTPEKVVNLNYYSEKTKTRSKVTLPYLNDYSTFYSEKYTKKMDTLEILKLFKKHINLVQKMHNSNIIHNDLWANNIMINSELDIKFIDFESIIIDDFISEEARCFNKYRNNLGINIKEYGIFDDKKNILNMYLNYLKNGDFKINSNRGVDIESLSLPLEIKKEIEEYIIYNKVPKTNYYFLDIIDELINNDYKSKILEKRR